LRVTSAPGATSSRGEELAGFHRRFSRISERRTGEECSLSIGVGSVCVQCGQSAPGVNFTLRRIIMRHQQLMKVALASLVALGITMQGSRAMASENATKDQAIAMVKKGITFIKANGVEKGYAAITDKKGQFQDRDLYLVV
jgi:hypothetical protein